MTSTQDGTYIDVTAVPHGVTVTGVVVKGGDAYNVYLPAALGGLPWMDLHAPLNGSGQPAGISHWFVCATETEQSTPVETTPVETTPVETTPEETTPEETTPEETTPEETTAEETTAEETTPEETTAEETTAEETEPEVSVEPTKVGSSPEVSVQGVKAGLAATGAGLPLPALLGASFALLLAGSALMVLPGRPVTGRGRHRRH